MLPRATAAERRAHGEPEARYPTGLLVRRAAVLGAGTMGAQIAALLANRGILCDLLELSSEEGGRDRLAVSGRERLLKLTPAPLYTPGAIALVKAGNLADHGSRLSEADLVIEAVIEDTGAKAKLWTSIVPFLKPSAVLATNTSGLSVNALAEALPEMDRRRFLGAHFFNPPRYMHLLEVIPSRWTEPAVVEAVTRFAENILGKGVVVARDTPNFIANRLGAFAVMAVLRAMEKHGLRPDEVDGITGPAMGRPSTATFRTLDLVGLDVFLAVCDNLRQSLPGDEGTLFEAPQYLREMVGRGWLGDKAGQGFFKRSPESEVLVLAPATLEYVPRRRAAELSVTAARNQEEPAKRVRVLLEGQDQAARFAWDTLAPVLAYAAGMVGEVADDIAGIDRAMRWGFNWELGPFETWDALGVATVAGRLRQEGYGLPAWASRLAERGGNFYTVTPERVLQATEEHRYVPVPALRRSISLELLRAGTPIAQKPGASLWDLGDDIAFLGFHSPKQAIGPDMLDMLDEAVRRAPAELRGLVIGSHVRPNFCVGANLMLVLLAAQDEDWDELDRMVRRFQQTMTSVRHLPIPVVAAPYGMTLGGGCEIAFAAHRVVCAEETYLGLVEVGAGIVPAGGGCKEMLLRALESVPGGIATLFALKGGAPALAPAADPAAQVIRAFETIGTAKVAASAEEAHSLGFLTPADEAVANLDQLLFRAKQTALAMDAESYRPRVPIRLPVLGEGARALMELGAQHMAWGGYASEHDLKIARRLARVLTGGDRPAGSWMTEQELLDLEREAFLSLCGEPKTQARMQHLLQTGRPLRN